MGEGQSLRFETQFLNNYLRMVEDTESPRLFHVWSAVSGLAASLGRRCWFQLGPLKVFPNQYIALVGTPGTRKSTAMNLMAKQLRKSTGVKFAPIDTAGQRQGLIRAMVGDDEKETQVYLDGINTAENNSLAGLVFDRLEEVELRETDPQFVVDSADKHHIMVKATELSRFLGQNNLQMLDFLVPMWDGEDYDYQTSNKTQVLKNPLINLIACTTPVSIHHSMPPAAGGQGFLSRMILVYGATKYKVVPTPIEPDEEDVIQVREVFHEAWNLAGEFTETSDGQEFRESVYGKPLEITDPRFGYYHERRQDHLIKLAMALCASRGEQIITTTDYQEANRILRATERGMPDALGEFGMNPLAALKQAILEYLRHHGATQIEDLRAAFHRDSRMTEFNEAVNDLRRLNQIGHSQLPNGNSVLMPKSGFKNAEDEMLKALAQA
jgi:hypothetical protein